MKHFFIGFLLFLSFQSHAQRKSPDDYKIAISFNPLALAHIDYTFLPGIEYKLQENLSIVGEAGYIFASSALGMGDGDARGGGFIIRPGLRFYVNPKNNFYLQPQFFYKQVSHRLRGWVGRDCVNDVPTYEELSDYRLRRIAYGVNITAGKVWSILNGGGLVDFYFGAGIRHRERKFIGDERSCVPDNSERVNFFGDGLLPSLPLGMRLCFFIR
jgi:hypothetical protein